VQGEKQVLDAQNEGTEEIRCCPNSQAAKQKLQPTNGTRKPPCANRKTIGKINIQENEPDGRTQIWRTKERKNEQRTKVRHILNFFIEI
jgi:hypothetical protein